MHKLLLSLLIISLIYSCKKISSPSNNSNNNYQPAITTTGSPIGSPATKTIGTSGGSLVSPDGKFTLNIPAGALSNDLAIAIQTITNQAPGGIGVAYDLLPNGTKFTIPVTLSYHYTPNDADGTNPNFMYIVTQDSTGAWSFDQTQADVDTVSMTVSTSTPHFSSYALIPDLQMSFGKKEFHKGESNYISVNQMHAFQQSGLMIIASGVQVPDQDVNNWSLNDLGKATVYGNIAGDGGRVTFQAPDKIDQQQSVKVSAEVTGPLYAYEKGMKITLDKVTLADHITLIPDSLKVPDSLFFIANIDIELSNTSGYFNDGYIDGGSFVITVVNGIVSIPVDSIQNEGPIVSPQTYSSGNTQLVWIPDNIGLVNITSGSGFVLSPDSAAIFLTHSGTVTPKWQITVDGLTTTFGGDSSPGWPLAFSFSLTDKAAQWPFKLYEPGNTWLITITRQNPR